VERHEVFLGEERLGRLQDDGRAMADAIDSDTDRAIGAIGSNLTGTLKIVKIGVIRMAGNADQVRVKISPSGDIKGSGRRRLSHGSKLGRP
jgi:lipopolysaccharide biosynthesis protein